jgi:hypothetical protein
MGTWREITRDNVLPNSGYKPVNQTWRLNLLQILIWQSFTSPVLERERL